MEQDYCKECEGYGYKYTDTFGHSPLNPCKECGGTGDKKEEAAKE